MTDGARPIVVELAGTPIGKGRPRFSRKSGTAYTPAKTRSYEEALGYAARAAMVGKKPLTGPISVHVIASFPIPASWPKKKQAAARAGEIRPTVRPDWENVAKVLDAFNKIVWEDDAQIVSGLITKDYSDHPSLHVMVWPLLPVVQTRAYVEWAA